MNNNIASTSTNASTHSIAQQTSERELTKQPFDSRTQAHLKVLIKLTRQNVKANHHIEILAKCVEEKRPPKGLVPRINPRLPITTSSFILDWEETLHLTGLKLTQKLLDYWTERSMQLQIELKQIRDSLEQIATPTQCSEINLILEDIMRNVQIDLTRKPLSRQASRTNLMKKPSNLRFGRRDNTQREQEGSPGPKQQ
jgi:hypothetical protein